MPNPTIAKSEPMDFGKPEVVATGVILSGVIGTLWALIMRMFKRDQKELKECRELHKEQVVEIKELHGQVEYLKGRMDGVEALSNTVLSKLEETRVNNHGNGSS